jgi:hypothetical protein
VAVSEANPPRPGVVPVPVVVVDAPPDELALADELDELPHAAMANPATITSSATTALERVRLIILCTGPFVW